MAGKPLNRLELRRQNDAAEPLDPMEVEADALLDDAEDEDGQERRAKKKKAPAKKPKAAKPAKPTARMRIVSPPGERVVLPTASRAIFWADVI